MKLIQGLRDDLRLTGLSPADAAAAKAQIQDRKIMETFAAKRAAVSASGATTLSGLQAALANANKDISAISAEPAAKDPGALRLRAAGVASQSAFQQIKTHEKRMQKALAELDMQEVVARRAAFEISDTKSLPSPGGGRANLNAFGEFLGSLLGNTGKGLGKLLDIPNLKVENIEIPNARPLEARERRSSFFTPEESKATEIAKKQLAEQKKQVQQGEAVKRLLERGLDLATTVVRF
jgi:hypothetical protein